jgi:hypothetical protein
MAVTTPHQGEERLDMYLHKKTTALCDCHANPLPLQVAKLYNTMHFSHGLHSYAQTLSLELYFFMSKRTCFTTMDKIIPWVQSPVIWAKDAIVKPLY